MHRIDGPAAAPGNQFTEGDPNVGTPASVVTDDWLNAVQEEIAGVIEGAGASLAKPSNNQLLLAVRALIDMACPPGKYGDFAVGSVPSGWLRCDGSLVSRSAYPRLFAAIGSSYGPDDGLTNFRLPEQRGEFNRNWAADRLGVDEGRSLYEHQMDQLGSHAHTTTSGQAPTNSSTGGSGFDNPVADGGTTGVSGGPETRPRNMAQHRCIRHGNW